LQAPVFLHSMVANGRDYAHAAKDTNCVICLIDFLEDYFSFMIRIVR